MQAWRVWYFITFKMPETTFVFMSYLMCRRNVDGILIQLVNLAINTKLFTIQLKIYFDCITSIDCIHKTMLRAKMYMLTKYIISFRWISHTSCVRHYDRLFRVRPLKLYHDKDYLKESGHLYTDLMHLWKIVNWPDLQLGRSAH